MVVGSWGSGSGTWSGPEGGLSPLVTQSQPLLRMFSRSCRSAHSLACLLRSRSAWAASFSFCTSATRSSNADAMFVQSVEAALAFASNTSA